MGVTMSTTVLSIDGGGMKGIVSAIVLVELENQIKEYTGQDKVYLSEYFDLIAGTSTGSILAAFLLCPNDKNKPKFTAQDALTLYIEKGSLMFETNFFYKLRTLNGLLGPRYKNIAFKKELTRYFGTIKTKDLLCPCLLTSYNTQTRESYFFNSLSCLKREHYNYYLSDAVLASTAAPTYFKPSCTKSYGSCIDCLIDGGVFANNPSLCALTEALKLEDTNSLSDIMLLSIGNVRSTQTYSYKQVSHWGILKWGLPLLDIFMDGSEQTVHYQIKKLFANLGISNQYLRILATVPEDVPSMDSTSLESIKRLIAIGEELVEKNRPLLKNYAHSLVDNRLKNPKRSLSMYNLK